MKDLQEESSNIMLKPEKRRDLSIIDAHYLLYFRNTASADFFQTYLKVYAADGPRKYNDSSITIELLSCLERNLYSDVMWNL